MRIFNHPSHRPDAYRELQEAHSETGNPQPEHSPCPTQPDRMVPDNPQQNHRHSVEQAEARGRYLVVQAEARARQSVPGYSAEMVARDCGKKEPYPQDIALIRRFCEGAGAGDSNATTVKLYQWQLVSMSAYLRQRQLPAISARLFSSELDNEVKQYELEHKRSDCLAILRHLRSIESSKQGVTTIPAYKMIGLSTDQWLIEQAFSNENNMQTVILYQSALRGLSAWLAEKGKPGLCDPDYLHSDELTAEAREFGHSHRRQNCMAALKQLRSFDLTGKVSFGKQRDTRSLPAADRLLITRYQKRANDALILKAARSGKKINSHPKRPTSVDNCTSMLRSFSGWLQQQNKGTLASLLHDPLLDTYKNEWAQNKSPGYASNVKSLLKQLRDMPVPDSSQPAASGRHSSLALPDSTWSGWRWDPDTPQEVTGPLRQPQPAASDSVFGDLSSLNSLSYQEVSGPVSQPRPAASYSVFGGLSSINALSYQQASEPSAQHDIVEVDSYPPPARETSVAQRLASDPWLRDNDLVGYTRHIAAQLQGQPRADLLHFVDPQQVRLLTEGNQRLRNEVLARLTGPATPPILLMPVNHHNQHWSLLCVNQQSGQAFHYDSMVSPETAHLATDTAQFGAASRVAGVVGVVGAPTPMPIARQTDTQSCGDHVLSGMEVLAHRTVSGEIFQPGGLDLSAVRPNRERIVAVLTENGA